MLSSKIHHVHKCLIMWIHHGCYLSSSHHVLPQYNHILMGLSHDLLDVMHSDNWNHIIYSFVNKPFKNLGRRLGQEQNCQRPCCFSMPQSCDHNEVKPRWVAISSMVTVKPRLQPQLGETWMILSFDYKVTFARILTCWVQRWICSRTIAA